MGTGANESPLPPGQKARPDFPRFGLNQYAERFPNQFSPRLNIGGDAVLSFELAEPLRDLPRVDMSADFHCVTTWSHRGLRWGGVRFADFYRARVEPREKPAHTVRCLVLRGQDGYRSTMLLEDLLVADVLLADTLSGGPLTIEHGAPLRLVAPAHYGYKSVKHLSSIECWTCEEPPVRPSAFRFMD